MSSVRPRPKSWIIGIAGGCVFLLYAPLVTIVFYSFLIPDLTNWGTYEWGTKWYGQLFTNATLSEALIRSLWIALVSATCSTILGTLAAWVLERVEFRGKYILDVLTVFPLAMPELVMGLALLIWFVFLRISLGSFSLILAHVTFCISYVVVTVRSRVRTLDLALLDAAKDLGADAWQRFRLVTFPLIRPGIIAGWLMAFMLSFDDFLVSFYTSGVGADTLPLKLYAMIKFGLNPELYALSSMMIVTGFCLISVIFFMNSKQKTPVIH